VPVPALLSRVFAVCCEETEPRWLPPRLLLLPAAPAPRGVGAGLGEARWSSRDLLACRTGADSVCTHRHASVELTAATKSTADHRCLSLDSPSWHKGTDGRKVYAHASEDNNSKYRDGFDGLTGGGENA
jgi:hypothetical protein